MSADLLDIFHIYGNYSQQKEMGFDGTSVYDSDSDAFNDIFPDTGLSVPFISDVYSFCCDICSFLDSGNHTRSFNQK